MDKPINYPAVILSGGKSSRMGEDKSLLPFDGYDTLIEYQYRKLQNIFQEVYISAKEDKFDFLEDKSKLLLDTSTIYSPMVALQKILKTFSDTYLFIIAVDTPFVQKDTIKTLYSKITIDTCKIIVPVDGNGNRHNLCGFYHTVFLKTVNQLLEDNTHKIGQLLETTNTIEIPFKEIKEFLNINDKDEYEKACSIFSSFSI